MHLRWLNPLFILCCLVLSLTCTSKAHSEVLEGSDGLFSRRDFQPFYLETDVGTNDRERKQYGARFAKIVSRNLDFFLKAFSMKAKDFNDYAEFYGAESGNFDPWIRIRLWRRFDTFLTDLQTRYDTKAIAGAFKGQIRPKDEYGEPIGPMFREISTYVEGQSDEAILQSLYHEMGHLFMQTFILYPVEVPSWLEEGTAQLFQYRIGNGTKPEAERLERIGWSYEMVTYDHDFGRAIPWKELVTVKNLDNLDFTYQNPIRSTQQYIQVWLMSEFFIGDNKRANAYFKLLNGLKKSAEEKLNRLWQQSKGKMSAQSWADLRQHLYSVQLDIFKASYGRDLLAVEELWKAWVKSEYERLLKRNPVMRYHRGTWHLDRRARLAPDEATRNDALTTAEKIFTEATEALPEDPAGYVGLARVAMVKGDKEGANAYFAKATELGSDFFEALVYGGLALIENGNAAAAVPGLEKALEERPSHWESTSFLGQALIISGIDIERGVGLVRSAVNQRQGQTELRLYEGVGHYLLGEYNSAAQSFADVFVVTGSQNVFAAAACAISRSRQLEDEEVEKWINIVRRLQPQIADTLQEQLLVKKLAIPLGFRPDGKPAIVGLTVDAEDAIIPKPAKKIEAFYSGALPLR